MGFREEVIAHFMDEEGLVSGVRDPGKWTSGNGLLYTGIFYTLLCLRREVQPGDMERFKKTVNLCYVDRGSQVFPGLLERNDKRPDLQAHDDYHGVVTASALLNTRHVHDVFAWGYANNWSYNNVDPEKWTFRTWHGRFPGQVAYYTMAARENPGVFGPCVLASKITTNALADPADAGGKILVWLMIEGVKGQHALCDEAGRFWYERMRRDYGSLGALFAKYFGPHHPFATV